MNPYLVIVVAALVLRYALDLWASRLNLKAVREELPEEFRDTLDAERYQTSQRYLKDNTRLGIREDTVQTAILLALILSGGMNVLDRVARSTGMGEVGAGLCFAGLLLVGATLLNLPFSAYRTFSIEARYGFNRTTPRTFVLDVLKSLVLGALLGGLLFAAAVWLFARFGPRAWIAVWAAMAVFQILIVFVAPYVIMPLFNRFTPLEDGELKTAVEDLARRQRFRIKGVYKMDGSRRSTKSNAFFTGLGRSRRIVLFDTLIQNLAVPELTAVVAHEIGHYKMGHVPRALLRRLAEGALTCWLLSLFIGNADLFRAFGVEQVSVYGALVFFGFLYTPIAVALNVTENAISRRHEYQADRFVVHTGEPAETLIRALKKLSVENLANLTPHRLKVVLAYSHPPILDRIRALRAL